MTITDISVQAFLCDGINESQGKLFAIGIGWNQIGGPIFPLRHSRMGVGVLISVPYNSTNAVHGFSLSIRDEDGSSIPFGDAAPGADPATVEHGRTVRVAGQFNVGRPPGLPEGDEQVVPLAIQLDGIEFPRPGRYVVVIEADGRELSRLPIRLVQVQAPPSTA